MQFLKLASLFALSAFVAAHPGGVHARRSDAEIAREAAASHKRSLLARNCASSIDAFKTKRMAKRGSEAALKKRQTSTSVAATPHVTAIPDDTCITAPELEEGPFYINNEYIRTNLAETQPGVPLVLDIGVIDTSTCEPISNAFVDIWSANSTGFYGGYSESTSTVHTATFLRGGYFTNDEGIVELTTVYPGFYSGRTAHIHTMIHTTWEQNANGTLISKAGSLVHIGQVFMDETWNDAVFATSPYTQDTSSRTLNANDRVVQQALGTDGYNPYLSLEYLGSDLSGGLLGYITLGVDTSASYTINNANSL